MNGKKQNGTSGNFGKTGKTVKASKHDRKRPLCTELVFILDASGSMGGLEDDTIGGFNTMIDENRELPGEAKVSVVTFSDRSRVLFDRVDIAEVPHLTRKTYRCSGCTALLDAVGGTIEHIDLVQRVQPKGYEAQKVLFAITTDGMENASRGREAPHRTPPRDGLGVHLHRREHRRGGGGGSLGHRLSARGTLHRRRLRYGRGVSRGKRSGACSARQRVARV